MVLGLMAWWSVWAQAGMGDDPAAQLVVIRRVYVDKFSGGESAAQVRDMIIASLQRSKLVVVTENAEKADAVMRGSAEDVVYVEVFQSSEGVSGRLSLGTGRGTSTRTREYSNSGVSLGENESVRQQERKHEAVASVRLVSKDGDVVWATTQESQGAKFLGAGADVAEKITKQLGQDMERQRGGKAAGAGPGCGASKP